MQLMLLARRRRTAVVASVLMACVVLWFAVARRSIAVRDLSLPHRPVSVVFYACGLRNTGNGVFSLVIDANGDQSIRTIGAPGKTIGLAMNTRGQLLTEVCGGQAHTEVHLVDLATRQDEQVATIPGNTVDGDLSDDGRIIVAYTDFTRGAPACTKAEYYASTKSGYQQVQHWKIAQWNPVSLSCRWVPGADSAVLTDYHAPWFYRLDMDGQPTIVRRAPDARTSFSPNARSARYDGDDLIVTDSDGARRQSFSIDGWGPTAWIAERFVCFVRTEGDWQNFPVGFDRLYILDLDTGRTARTIVWGQGVNVLGVFDGELGDLPKTQADAPSTTR